MQIQINTGHNIDDNESMRGATTDIVAHALRHFSDRITRVELHLANENGAKGGPRSRAAPAARGDVA